MRQRGPDQIQRSLSEDRVTLAIPLQPGEQASGFGRVALVKIASASYPRATRLGTRHPTVRKPTPRSASSSRCLWPCSPASVWTRVSHSTNPSQHRKHCPSWYLLTLDTTFRLWSRSVLDGRCVNEEGLRGRVKHRASSVGRTGPSQPIIDSVPRHAPGRVQGTLWSGSLKTLRNQWNCKLQHWQRNSTRRGKIGGGGFTIRISTTVQRAWDRTLQSYYWSRWSSRGVMPLRGPLSQTPTSAVQVLHPRRRHQGHLETSGDTRNTMRTWDHMY
ncbi:hypothetical protein GE09DRAFT_152897 [Coniochaeta sp. 2T2.1]|nr:hypothetical protein GE09DRAFT_152897 [Coniochaeta sp. 2T2.1]